MRGSKNSLHGKGGTHISGAERLVSENNIEETVLNMIKRAQTHQKGKADFINLKIEEITEDKIIKAPLLKIETLHSASKEEGREIAKKELETFGIDPKAIREAFRLLENLTQSMRGAIVLDSLTGERLDPFMDRGIRCTNMDSTNSVSYEEALRTQGLKGEHLREALVLSSKVENSPYAVGELCWSDDPDYVTGYVSSKTHYKRITVMKEYGSPLGGRVFFVKHETDMETYIDYIQNQCVLVEASNEDF